MKTLEKIDFLLAKLNSVEPYATNCVAIKRRMHCRAFFPGGDGLWLPNQHVGPITTLFLGSDFNNEVNFNAEFEKPKEYMRDSPRTWHGLAKLIEATEIDTGSCFFTNAWPCLRRDDYPNTGNPPGAKDAEFTSRCLAYFELTLELLKPRFIITLGTWPTWFVHHLAPREMKDWQRPKWKSIDRTDRCTVLLNGNTMTFIPAIHPCLPNYRYRTQHKSSAVEASHIRAVISSSTSSALRHQS